MRLSDIVRQIRATAVEAGVNDPYIFKAIFLAGGPGSGKTFIAKQMFEGIGLKFVNSDLAFEYLLRKKGLSFDIDPKQVEQYSKQMVERDKAKRIEDLQKAYWVDGMLGLVLDGTGKDYDKIKGARAGLEALGYDTGMVFVNTTLEVAHQRNQERERTVPEEVVTESWNAVQGNLGRFQSLFGGRHFFVVDNSEVLDKAGVQRLGTHLRKTSLKWLNQPLKNHVGLNTIEVLRKIGGKLRSDLAPLLRGEQA